MKRLVDMCKDRKNKLILVFFCTVIIGNGLIYVYSDPIITQAHGIVFWDALFQGKIFDYYRLCMEKTGWPAVYDFSIYLIFAIWNFPCWLFQHITGYNAQNYGVWIFYGKILMLFAYFISIQLVRKIISNVRKVDDEYFGDLSDLQIVAFYSTSVLILIYNVYTGNYDVLELIFMLAGINSLVQNNKKKFILFFSIATSMKLFAIWIYIPIILLKEKKIPKIVLDVALCFGVTFVEKAVFDNDKILNEYQMYTERIATNEFSLVAHAGKVNLLPSGSISLCFVAYAFLCIYCYIQKEEFNSNYIKKVMYVATVAWSIFFLFVPYNCYWIVLIVPFMMFVALSNKENTFLAVLLESFCSYGVFINSNLRQGAVVGNEGVFENGVINGTHALLNGVIIKFCGQKLHSVYVIGDVFNAFNEVLGFDIYINSIIVATIVAFIIINYPSERVHKVIPYTNVSNHENNVLLKVHNYTGIAVFLLPTIYYCYQIMKHNI